MQALPCKAGSAVMNCLQCRRELTADEIAVYRRMVHRGAQECLCITCFAKKFDVTEEMIRDKICYFKAMGCTLFTASPSDA